MLSSVVTSTEGPASVNHAREDQDAQQPDQDGHDGREVPEPERCVGTQFPDVLPVLNIGDRDGEGADADEQQPQNSDGALLVQHLQELVDRNPKGDHGKRGSNPRHEAAFGRQPRAVDRRLIVEF